MTTSKCRICLSKEVGGGRGVSSARSPSALGSLRCYETWRRTNLGAPWKPHLNMLALTWRVRPAVPKPVTSRRDGNERPRMVSSTVDLVLSRPCHLRPSQSARAREAQGENIYIPGRLLKAAETCQNVEAGCQLSVRPCRPPLASPSRSALVVPHPMVPHRSS